MPSKWRRWASRVIAGADRRGEQATAATQSAGDERTDSAEQGSLEPRLIELHWDGPAAQLLIAGLAAAPASSALLLVGRKSKDQVSVRLGDGQDRRSASIRMDDVSEFGSEAVDLFVADPVRRTRHRLAAGDDSPLTQPGAPRRFFVTGGGNLSLRRRNATEIITESGVFDAEFYRSQVPDLDPGIDPIQHYLSAGAASGLNPSVMFDTRYYLEKNPLVLRWNPLAHYCEHGWKELRNPSPRFNTWWYWAKHLGLSSLTTNPLAHYQAVGRHAGLSTLPDPHPSRILSEGQRHPLGRGTRRICLFGGYDPEGIVDDCVVGYVRELSRFADVYYLADCEMSEKQLAKLSPYTRGAWAERHGEYDFGSYARLADRVGWSAIEQYDELLLVNDSCYLLRPLDDVFAQMDLVACDWWGLQATKGIYQTRELPQNRFDKPIGMHEVRAQLVDDFERDYIYDFHIASFFVSYRSTVIKDPEFRRYLCSVTAQGKKRDIVKKYEVGLTHWLIQHGHSFDTFVPSLYPFHPVFTDWYFQLLADGFPLLKRQFLAENLYQVPGLARWQERVRQVIPDVDLSSIDRNLSRVVDPDRLRQSLNIGESSAEGIVDRA